MKKALLGCLLTMAVAFVFLNPCPSLAGPFGTNMGDAKEKFKNLIDAGDNNYLTRDVPLRHSVFAEYFLLFGENGLNGVIAQSTYKNDRFGIQAQNAYKKVKEQLIKKYGEPEIKEFLREGALFKDDSEFVMSLYKSERVHACVWELKKDGESVEGEIFRATKLSLILSDSFFHLPTILNTFVITFLLLLFLFGV